MDVETAKKKLERILATPDPRETPQPEKERQILELALKLLKWDGNSEDL